MVQAAYRYPQIRQFSTSTEHDIISASGRQLHYKNSNALVREGAWDIELSKRVTSRSRSLSGDGSRCAEQTHGDGVSGCRRDVRPYQ